MEIIDFEKKKTLKNGYKREYNTKKNFFCYTRDCLPKAYGLPKIYKQNTPFRIIVSSINTTLYPIAKFLRGIILDSFPPTISFTNNSFELFNAFSKISLPESDILVSMSFHYSPMYLSISP